MCGQGRRKAPFDNLRKPVKRSLLVIDISCRAIMYLFQIHQLFLLVGVFGRHALEFGNAHAHGHNHIHLHLKDLEKRSLLSTDEPISVTGDHEWQAPGEGDQRGPCPGMSKSRSSNVESY